MNRLRPIILLTLLAVGVHAQTLPEAGLALIRSKDYLGARDLLHKIVEVEPQNAAAHFYLGIVAEKLHENDEAIRQLEQATALAPTKAEYFLELGGAYGTAANKAGLLAKLDWAHKCQLALEKAVQLNPDNLEARNGLVSFYREAPSFAGGGLDKAVAQAEEIRKRDPLMGAAVLGQLYLSEHKVDEAFAVYEAALKAAPDHYGTLYAIGRAAAQTGQHLARGAQALRRCLTLTPGKGDPGHAPVQWRLGNIAEKSGDPAGARAAYQAALTLDPTFQLAADSLAKLK